MLKCIKESYDLLQDNSLVHNKTISIDFDCVILIAKHSTKSNKNMYWVYKIGTKLLYICPLLL